VPVASTVKLPAVPAVNVVLDGLVIAGAVVVPLAWVLTIIAWVLALSSTYEPTAVHALLLAQTTESSTAY
jgi:hypothetical protein